jgi:hypothetical protein
MIKLERREVPTDWNRTHTTFPQNACIHDIFEMQALNPHFLIEVRVSRRMIEPTPVFMLL